MGTLVPPSNSGSKHCVPGLARRTQKGEFFSQKAYAEYGLYNSFSAMNHADKNVLRNMPKGILLSDWHAWEVLNSGVPKRLRHVLFPGDFAVKGGI